MIKLETSSRERRKLWQDIFEQDWLPIKIAQPREVCLPSRGTVLAYEVDLSWFHWMRVCRAARNLMWMHHVSYEIARKMLEDDLRFIVVSNDLAVVEPQAQPLFPFLRGINSWTRQSAITLQLA